MMSLLKGLKILDFSTLLPGPYATMMLADLGAEVLRIESPNRHDLVRHFPPQIDGQSAAHMQLNRNKMSLGLDLKQPEAVDIIKKLLNEYDIVLEQFRPGVMKRLGLDYDSLKETKPELIYCSITGYGQTGPYSSRPGHDINYLSVSGISGFSGRKTTGPTLLGTQAADIAGGSLHSIIGLLSAVIHRNRTGEGQYIDISMADGCFAMNSMLGAGYVATGLMQPEPENTVLNGSIFYDYYQTSDGRYFSVGSLEPKFRKLLCEGVGRPDLLPLAMSPDHSKQQQTFKEELSAIFLSRTFEEWCEIFSRNEACVEPVLSFAEACEHPQLQARQMIVKVADAKGGTYRQIANPIKSSAFIPEYNQIGSELGADTDSVLCGIGVPKHRIEELRSKGVIA
jgi:alpha-methylacyl-CoA racemase